MSFYLISPPIESKDFSLDNFKKVIELIDVKYLQLRPKYQNEKHNKNFILNNFKIFNKICRTKNIKLIVNDDVFLARELGADGVHIGQNDLNCRSVREILGPTFIIGVSCNNSVTLAQNAKKNGANYVAFGPMFKSQTKYSDSKLVDIENLRKKKKQIPLPFTLIGGINHNNIGKLRNVGFDSISMIQSIWNYKNGPVKSARKFNELGF